MESLLSLDWSELFGLSVPLSEILVRGTATYWFLFLIFQEELRSNLREEGVESLAQVKNAYMESDGQIGVVHNSEKRPV